MKFIFCTLVVLATVVSLWAQADANKGQISGTVFDPNQAVIPNAEVKIQNVNNGQSRELRSNESGLFRAVLLDPGIYTVTVSAPGFAATTLTNVELNVGGAVNLPVVMQIGSTTQTIEVGASLVQIDTPNPQSIVNSQAIRDLPINGRRFQEFAVLTPTAQIDPDRGSISFAAQRGINGNIMIDGADYNNPFFGGTRGGERSNYIFTVPQSSIQEFQAITTGYAAEYGRSTGGILNAITKSGTNDYHGEAFYQIRHKETGLENPFGFQQLETLQQFGGAIGGPIKHDKLFWYAAAESQRAHTPRQTLFGTLNGITPKPSTQEAYSFIRSQEKPLTATNNGTAVLGRMDWDINQNNRLAMRFNWSDASAENAITTGGALPTFFNQSYITTGTEMDKTDTGVAQLTTIFSPRTANDLRFSGTYEERPRTANGIGVGISAGTIGTLGTRNFLPTTQNDTRYQINDALSMQVGSHTFKFGGDYNYLTTFQQFGFNQFGSFSFSTSDPNTILKLMSTAPGQNRFDDPRVRYTLQIGNLIADYNMQQIAFYAQDQWRVNNQFQINYGVRWEGQMNPDPVATNTAVVTAIQNTKFPNGQTFDPTQLHDNMNQWMPRFGFTYTPSRFSSKTVIRGHTGLFYAASPMLIFGGTNNNFRIPPGDVGLFYAPGAGQPTAYKLFQGIGIDLNSYSLDKLPILTPDQYTQALATALGTAPDPYRNANFTGTANDYQNPRAFQAGLGADQQLSRNWGAGIQLNYVNTVHLERNRDYNLPIPTLRASDGRYVFNRNNRPLPQYGQLTIRESSARSMYRGMTLNTQYRGGRFQFGAFYTLAEAFSDDDNERSASGFVYDNPYNFRPDYGYSALDVRHQFTSYAVYRLPWGIEVSGIGRFFSGRPIDPVANADVNGDASNSDRAFSAPGVEFERNSFRNRGIKQVDFRFLKSFPITERIRVQFSTELFNVFNFDNVLYGGNALTYGPGINPDGSAAAPRSDANGPTFMRLKLPNGAYDPVNNQSGFPFQAQFGLRLLF